MVLEASKKNQLEGGYVRIEALPKGGLKRRKYGTLCSKNLRGSRPCNGVKVQSKRNCSSSPKKGIKLLLLERV